ncbi:MAG: ribosomal protein S18-alanine N-acetyltransferase [SAR324 cluster bacterium]|nr:ribosomal protein S18-alanine N-acetyltransferase [SAR324 cluster bacterium]
MSKILNLGNVKPLKPNHDKVTLRALEQLVELDEDCLPSEAWHSGIWEAFLEKRLCLLLHDENAFALFTIAADEAEIIKVGVRSKMRRQGLAKKMLTQAFGILISMEIKKVALEVRSSNEAAKKLYESLGFTKAGLRKSYYRHPAEDAQIWIKQMDGVQREKTEMELKL